MREWGADSSGGGGGGGVKVVATQAKSKANGASNFIQSKVCRLAFALKVAERLGCATVSFLGENRGEPVYLPYEGYIEDSCIRRILLKRPGYARVTKLEWWLFI